MNNGRKATPDMTAQDTSSDELPQDHPLKAQPDRDRPVTAVPEPDWKAEATRLNGEARFWQSKYFEALQHSQSQTQVIAMLARPQIEQDARQQADLIARLSGLQANS